MLPNFIPKRLDTPAGEILLREVQRKDLKALNRVINDPSVNRFLLVPPPVSMKSTVWHYEDCKKSGRIWVACIFDGAVVGSVELKPKPGREAHVSDFGIAFSKKVHGKGIARAAVEYCFAWLAKSGMKKIVCETFEKNLRARKFYGKLGFEEKCILKKHVRYGNRYFGAVMIEKFL
jgi:RimJ/RimL family protein N-acetyltransferase